MIKILSIIQIIIEKIRTNHFFKNSFFFHLKLLKSILMNKIVVK